MKSKLLLLAFLAVCSIPVLGQDIITSLLKDSSRTPINKWYRMSATELIFSGGEVKSGGMTLDNVVRFSAFFHVGAQSHYNFNNTFGIYTGLGLRNIGLINRIHINDALGDMTLKQRAYSIGVPLALKIGNMKKGAFLALGGEAEFMFAYKEKLLYNDQKIKNYETIGHWFAGDYINTFNPSLFADIRFKSGSYIRFKYYMNDFLKSRDRLLLPPTTTTYVHYNPESSKMFYIAIGTSFRERLKKKHHANKTEV